MQAQDYLAISAKDANTNGWIDIVRTQFQPYCNTAGAVTAANNFIAAVIAERNNIHTLLNDGITEVAPTIAAAAADDGGKMRYIVQGLIGAVMATTSYPVGVDQSNSAIWYNAANSANKPVNVSYRELKPFGLPYDGMDLLVNTTPVTEITTYYDLRFATLATLKLLWDAVDTL